MYYWDKQYLHSQITVAERKALSHKMKNICYKLRKKKQSITDTKAFLGDKYKIKAFRTAKIRLHK